MAWWGWVGFSVVSMLTVYGCVMGLTWDNTDPRQFGVLACILTWSLMLWWSAWQ